MSVTMEELLAMGLPDKKAAESVKNKKLAASLRLILDAAMEVKSGGGKGDGGGAAAVEPVTAATHGANFTALLFDMATKIKGTVSAHTLRLLVTLASRPEGENIGTPEQIAGALKFVNSAGGSDVTEADL
eukprot:UC1_evm1s1191